MDLIPTTRAAGENRIRDIGYYALSLIVLPRKEDYKEQATYRDEFTRTNVLQFARRISVATAIEFVIPVLDEFVLATEGARRLNPYLSDPTPDGIEIRHEDFPPAGTPELWGVKADRDAMLDVLANARNLELNFRTLIKKYSLDSLEPLADLMCVHQAYLRERSLINETEVRIHYDCVRRNIPFAVDEPLCIAEAEVLMILEGVRASSELTTDDLEAI